MNCNRTCPQAVLFDFDGTLTLPGAIDFGLIRNAIGCPSDCAILEFIDSLEEAAAARARSILGQLESRAARESRPNLGAEDLLRSLREHGIPVGIISRNCRGSIVQALKNFHATEPSDFSVIITRDDPIKAKPSPDGIHSATRNLGVSVSDIIWVGDYLFDVTAGSNAGAYTVYISNGALLPAFASPPDAVIECLRELHLWFENSWYTASRTLFDPYAGST